MKKSLRVLVALLFVAVTLGFMASEAGAWVACAQVNPNGTLAAGSFRVNTSTLETRRLSTGTYEIDFTPVSTDVTRFARLATVENQTYGTPPIAIIGLADRAGDVSSVWVQTRFASGAAVDAGFSLCIY